jgi:ATP-dependent helicase/nuclease subunit A
LEWKYPAGAATTRKAKSSVTELRREADELDEESERVFTPKFSKRQLAKTLTPSKKKLSATDIGLAHHKFLEHVDLSKISDLVAEADRLARANYLTIEERAALDLGALEHFWNSALGRDIAAHAAEVRRELPFTARFSPAEIETITGKPAEAGLENEFIVVQGVADLVVLKPKEIWLVDFKTDEVTPHELAKKVETYQPQVRFYVAALEKIFGRPVTRRALHFLAAHQTQNI